MHSVWSLSVNWPIINSLNENQQDSEPSLTWAKKQNKTAVVAYFFRPPVASALTRAEPFPFCCTVTCYPKDWPHRHCSWQKQGVTCTSGCIWSAWHLIQGDHLKLKLHFSPALTFSSFPPLVLSDTGLTKVLIRSLPQPHCVLSCLWGSAHHVPHHVSKLS